MVSDRRSILAVCGRWAAAVVAGCCLGPGQLALAQDSYVVELFTSQGCSSCPRADQWLAAIARGPDVVAVSFPVDYWDYIGWRDTLASPAHTARQKAYADANGEGRVYTPQVIVNGLAAAAGGDEAEIEQAIRAAKGRDGAMAVNMRLSRANSHYLVEVAEGGNGPASVLALRVARATTVHILRGENAGKQVTYTNVVRGIEKLGDWTGGTATFDLPGVPHDGEGFVVLLQKGTPGRPGPILAAAKSEGL
ncbi:MAG: DUF1223 domain-containing protein [Beijerinckiaceae bacterium]|nr:DUF1223 domain-containing protein [Beijerinckiaceae bacterium]MCI0736400.1 DUF1223 domain-containing protein [Beijerinckiaceae bacterium]